MMIREEHHGGIPESMPANPPGGLAEAVDFGWGQVLPGTDVGIFVALGKCALWHTEILPAQLSCFRWLALQQAGSAA
jgi:hypothetical protein